MTSKFNYDAEARTMNLEPQFNENWTCGKVIMTLTPKKIRERLLD